MIDDMLDKRLESVAQQMAEKEERIFYEAAQEKAEAIIFVRNGLEEQPMDKIKVRFGFKYKICDRIEEVKDAKKVFDTFEFVEIPAYLHRLANETDNFDEFRRKFKYEHPGAMTDQQRFDLDD